MIRNYYFSKDGIKTRCYPLGVDKLKYKYEKETDNGRYFWRKKLSGKLSFVQGDFAFLYSIELLNLRCSPIIFIVEKMCSIGGTPTEEYVGELKLSTANFNLDKCVISVEISISDPYTCLLKNADTDVNVLSGTTKESVYYIIGELEFTSRTFAIVTLGGYPDKTNKRSPFYWFGSLLLGVPPPGWMFYKIYEGDTLSGFTVVGTSFWVREFINLPIGDDPPIGFEQDGFVGSDIHWVRQPIIIDRSIQTYDVADVNPPSGTSGTGYEWEYAGIRGDKDFSNAISLNTALYALLNNTTCGAAIKSDFFQINPDIVDEDNYVTGLTSKTNMIYLVQKSDAKRPDVSTAAVNGLMNFNDLMTALDTMFYCKYFIDITNRVCIEHISSFNLSAGIDITSIQFDQYTKGKKSYSYDMDSIPYKETFAFMEANSLDFKGKDIQYIDTCASDQSISHDAPNITTDLEYVMSSDAVSDEGFVMLACAEFNGKKYIIQELAIFKQDYFSVSEYHHNNSLAFAQLHKDYHTHKRALLHGVLNDTYQQFISSINAKKGVPISIPLSCGTDFEPNSITVGVFGNAETGEASYSIKDCMLELELLYDAAQANIYYGLTYLKLVLENIQGPVVLDSPIIYDNIMYADVVVYVYADAAGTIRKWVNNLSAQIRVQQTKNYEPIFGSPYTVDPAPIDNTININGYKSVLYPGRQITQADIVSYTGVAPYDWKTETRTYTLLPSIDYTII